MDRGRLLEELGWLAEGNPRYAATDEEDRQNPAVAHMMADDLLLAFVDDEEVTTLFNRIRGRRA